MVTATWHDRNLSHAAANKITWEEEKIFLMFTECLEWQLVVSFNHRLLLAVNTKIPYVQIHVDNDDDYTFINGMIIMVMVDEEKAENTHFSDGQLAPRNNSMTNINE